MLRFAAKSSSRALINNGKKRTLEALKSPIESFSSSSSGASNRVFTASPVALDMIKYATSLARDQKTDDSYARGLLVLDQCESIQPDDNSKGLVELARSTLLFERGSHEAAIERLGKIQDLGLSSIATKVAALEALGGIYLERYQEDATLAVADLALQFLEMVRSEIGEVHGIEVLESRAKAMKGLTELICGNLDSARSIFEGGQGHQSFRGNAALSCGEFLHGTKKFSAAKELYQKVIRETSDVDEISDPNYLGACGMIPQEVSIAATCALGQVESHMGNFTDSEESLTSALKMMEQRFGPNHPKVGAILTCIALMYQRKAVEEQSSSLLIQEGLFRRANELLKAPPLDSGDDMASDEIRTQKSCSSNVYGKDIIALARGGYAEVLGVQQSRKAEAERMKEWAEKAWGNNRWMSLGEAIEFSHKVRVPVIDTRICRAL